MRFLEKVKKTIARYQMLEPGDKVVVGVSGGPDSMALLHVLNHLQKHYRLTLMVAHINHGFRGREACQEAEFVEKVVHSMNLPCEVKTFDVPSYKREHSLSSQEAGRVIRYQFLEEVRERFRGSKIAVGHNANDQAETILMWLLRGTGLKGLAGMPPVRGGVIIRPLIEVTREEIEAFVSEKKIPFVVDSSNRKTDYLRNRIRQELLPLLQTHYNPQIVSSLVHTGTIVGADNEYLEHSSRRMLNRIILSSEKDRLTLHSERLGKLPLALQLRCLRAVLEQVKGDLRLISFIHLYEILKLMFSEKPHCVLKLPQDIRVEKSYRTITIARKREPAVPFFYQFDHIPDAVIIEEIGKKLAFTIVEKEAGIGRIFDSRIACLDGEKIAMPLIIRSVKPGDRFQPLGMKGEKKIKDFFIDEKVSYEERRRTPLLFLGKRLAWVGGMRIDHRLRVTGDTRKILIVEMRDEEEKLTEKGPNILLCPQTGNVG